MIKAKSKRTNFIHIVLLIKWIITLLVWGLPMLLGPPSLFEFFGLPFPSDTIYLRLFGAVVTALTLAYYYAWRNPVQNNAIIKFGILDNGLATITLVILGLTVGFIIWVSAVLTTFFFISFTVYILRVK